MSRLTTLFACSMFAFATVCSVILPAQADEKLTLRQRAVGNDRAFIKQFMDNQLRDYGRKFDPWKVWVGRADISRDGKPELFVFMGDTAFCGSVGCVTYIFRKISGKWTHFTDFSVLRLSTDSHSEASLYLKDEGGPYLTMYSYYYGLRWSNNYKDFESFCPRTCPR